VLFVVIGVPGGGGAGGRGRAVEEARRPFRVRVGRRLAQQSFVRTAPAEK